MGLIPVELDEAFEAVEMNTPLQDGVQTGTVVAAEVKPSRVPWRDAELSVRIASDNGGTAFADIEAAPLVDKEGNRSEGKLKFLKWQLEALGYTGTLSELESNVESIIGNKVRFKVTTTDSKNINPNTGTPYRNRDVVIEALIAE